jgi:hypothetical protein
MLRRAVDEGHEIGNHTFTHPNISSISPTQLELELSATKHLLASEVGRHSLLFRSPYAVDAEPETIDQVRPVELAAARLCQRRHADRPGRLEAPGGRRDRQTRCRAAERGEGNIVLLHDSGGDRTQTMQAIPRIVEELHKRGFEFVTVSELLGRSRDAIMPPVPPEEQWRSRLDGAAFAVLNWAARRSTGCSCSASCWALRACCSLAGSPLYQRWRSAIASSIRPMRRRSRS